MGSARPLAQVYRRFARADHPDASPLYKRVALALSESDEALRAIESGPARKRNPALILAALHDLALAGPRRRWPPPTPQPQPQPSTATATSPQPSTSTPPQRSTRCCK